MYRRGIAPSKIAEVCGAAATTVRYHLQIAAKGDPGLRGEHAAALPVTVPTPSEASLQKMQDLVAFYQAGGTAACSPCEVVPRAGLGQVALPSAPGISVGDPLSPFSVDGLSAIPGWDQRSRGKAADEARWQQRLKEVKALRKAGGEWPRHQKTDDPQERTLGVWLHGQCINYNHGKLAREKKLLLDKVLPGWRDGRPRGGLRAS